VSPPGLLQMIIGGVVIDLATMRVDAAATADLHAYA
jgi:hypothetical protein